MESGAAAGSGGGQAKGKGWVPIPAAQRCKNCDHDDVEGGTRP